MKKLEGKVALVIASECGIGLVCAKKLAQNGALTYLGGMSDGHAKKKIEECKNEGLCVEFVQCEATGYESYEQVVREVTISEGRLDILVNHFEEYPDRDLDIVKSDPYVFFDLLQKNIGSVYLPCKAAISYMAEQGGGSIVNISSNKDGKMDLSGAGYSVSKSAINYLSQTIARQCAQKGVRCNVVVPEMSMFEESGKKYLSAVPQKRAEVPEALADAVVFFASDDSSCITGMIKEVAGEL